MTRRTRFYVANVKQPTLTWGNLVEEYTEYKAVGAWQGTREPTTVIEVLGSFNYGLVASLTVVHAASEGEDSILVTVEDSEGLQAYLVYYVEADDFVRWERVT